MDSAGYMTTTIFYWWVLAAAMIAFLPIYFHYNNEKVKTWIYALAVPCSIFAANQEQAAIIFVCLCMYMLGIYLFEKRKIPKYVVFLLLVGLISLAIVFLCSVNKVVHAFDFDQPIVYYHGFLPLKLCLLVLAYTFTCLCVVFAMYVLWGPTKKFSHLMAVLVSGAASKVSMGMSPTVWASSERTIIFLLFGFVIIAVSCAEIIFKKQKY